MEFMKETEDVYMEHYQDNGNVAWIGRHLEGEAAVWWRLIKNSVTNFAEFKEAFTNKYWSDMKMCIRDSSMNYPHFQI